jgi:uncharacterized membrane protein (TIGR02234 family)
VPGRWPVVLAALAGAGAVLLASGRVWAEGRVAGLSGTAVVSVTGRESQPVLPALALLAGAAAAALAIGGRAARLFSAAALALAGAGVVAVAVGRAAAPSRMAAALDPAAARLTGIRGLPVLGVEVSGWPWLAVAGGVLVALAGLVGLLAGRRWPDRGARYDRAPDEGGSAPGPEGDDGGPGDERPEDGAAAVWDALSRGEDPTAGRPGR